MTFNLERTRTNEQKRVVGGYKDVSLKVNYFWDSHGNLINWNHCVEEQTTWPKADVQIIKYTFTEHLLGKDLDFKMHQLNVNGKLISGDVISHKAKDEMGELVVYCDVVVGWG
jgi:hypothetical protein